MNELEKQWYAVYTRPRFEKKISQTLAKKGIEHFCPLNRILRQWADRKKMVSEPLFSCYVFVRIPYRDAVQIRQVDGIKNFVHWLGMPAVIRNEEIEAVRQFLNDHENVHLEKIQVNMNDRVRILAGPLMMEEGKVIEVRNRTIKVCLPSLGYVMSAEVTLTNIEIIKTNTGSLKNKSNEKIR